MRRAVPTAAAACLLIAPTVLAFYSGGYYSEPRLIAAIVVWALVLALALAGPAPLPRGRAGAVALAGLLLMTCWSALSIAWAPLGGPAIQDVERLALYTGALLLAIGALRRPGALRATEPALAAGATVVIGYGLAGRLLPGIIELAHSRSAGGRLEQPITYWNAEGALAAIGLVLCARLAGDRLARGRCARSPRPRSRRSAPASTCRSRAARSRSRCSGSRCSSPRRPIAAQLRASVVALVTAAAAAACAAPFPGVASLSGTNRTREGAIVLALLVAVAVAALVATLRARPGPAGAAPAWAGRRRLVVGVLVAAVAGGLLLGGIGERPSAAELARGPTRAG